MKNFEEICSQLLRQFKECQKQPSYFDIIEIARRITDNFKNGGKTKTSPEVLVHYCTDVSEVEKIRKWSKIEYEEMKYNNMEFYIFSNLTNNKVDIMYYPVAL